MSPLHHISYLMVHYHMCTNKCRGWFSSSSTFHPKIAKARTPFEMSSYVFVLSVESMQLKRWGLDRCNQRLVNLFSRLRSCARCDRTIGPTSLLYREFWGRVVVLKPVGASRLDPVKRRVGFFLHKRILREHRGTKRRDVDSL